MLCLQIVFIFSSKYYFIDNYLKDAVIYTGKKGAVKDGCLSVLVIIFFLLDR
jgi:hypothetical protein